MAKKRPKKSEVAEQADKPIDVAGDFYVDGADWSPETGEPVVDQASVLDCSSDQKSDRECDYAVEASRSGLLYFDLETIPDFSRQHLFELDPIPDVPKETPREKLPAPASIVESPIDVFEKQLDKIEGVPSREWFDAVRSLEESSAKPRKGIFSALDRMSQKRQSVLDLHADRRKLLSTTPEFCRIVSAGYGAWSASGAPAVGSVTVAPLDDGAMDDQERQLLKGFWDLCAAVKSLVGFHISVFDLNVACVRSAILGVRPTRRFSRKLWDNEVIDLYALRYPKGHRNGEPAKLKSMAKVLGIPVPAEGMDGSQVYDAWMSDYLAVGRYCESDVRITMALHRMLEGAIW